jgi:methyl-accepting chemotaxis protein
MCWEYKKCGKDKDGACPAYPNNGLDCWRVTGTLCDGTEQGSFKEKIAKCRECGFYQEYAIKL